MTRAGRVLERISSITDFMDDAQAKGACSSRPGAAGSELELGAIRLENPAIPGS